MRDVRHIAFILGGLMLALAGGLPAQRLPFRHYNEVVGLSAPFTRALAQDADGLIWVGTANGLFRYDGERFEAFGADRGLPGTHVRALHVDRQGTLWAATREGLARWKGTRFEAVPVPTLSGAGQAGALDSTSQFLYLATEPGLVEVPLKGGGAPRRVPAPGGLLVRSVHVDNRGRVWAGCGSQVCQLQDGRLQRLEGLELPEDTWDALATDGAGTLWVRSSQLLYRLPLGAKRFERVEGDFSAPNGVTALVVSPAGRIVVPCEAGLFLQRQDRSWERIHEGRGLPADRVAHAIWDREGNLWVGLESYFVARQLGNGAWTGWTTAEGLTSNSVSALARDSGGRMWIGTALGLNRLSVDPEEWRTWRQRDGLPADDVRAMVADAYGGLWVGSHAGGLARLDTATSAIQRFGREHGLGNDRVVSLTLEADGTLWAPTRDGLYQTQVSQRPWRFERIEVPSHYGDSVVYRVMRARDGTLWAAGRQGLLRREGEGWKQFTDRDGLRYTNLVFLAEDGDGALWIGYGPVMGVSRVTFGRDGKPRFEHFHKESGLSSDNISFIEAGRRGEIWIGTDSGVHVYDAGQLYHFSTGDGLIWQDTILNAFLAEPDGGIWIGTTRGAAHFEPPQALRQVRTEPRVLFTTVETAFGLLAPGGTAILPFAQRHLRVRYTTPAYAAERQVEFRYRLKGSSRDWTVTRQRELVLRDLASGEYQLEVQARLPGSAWSAASAVLPVEIRGPWWSSWWFWSLVLSAFGLSIYLVWRQRFERHLVRQRQLEAAVAARTRVIDEQRQKVENQKREIELLLEEARMASRLREEFLANISHEIRTPMNGVIGMTSLALATPLDAEQREYLEAVDSSARSLLHLLNDILDFSKLDAGRVELERIPFSLTELVQSVHRQFQILAREKGLRLTAGRAADVPELVTGDPHRLRQVLVNLHSNALKFTSQGEVHLQASLSSRNESKARIRFEVIDTGIGIPAGKLDAIFDPFRQADGSTTRRYGGTGLGLAICRRLVEAMQGSIGVESVPGQGSTFAFEVELGVCAAAASPAPVISPEPPAIQVNARVLLVEDNDIGSRLASRLLEKHGCRVTPVHGGRDAVEQAVTGEFDAILMDLQMPDIDGLEATRQIRAAERHTGRYTPIIVLTANAGEQDRQRAFEAGADGFLLKPLDFGPLRAALSELTKSPALRKQ